MTVEAAPDPLGTLRRRSSEKWGTHAADMLPMFVAEMDFPLAPEIKEALREALDIGDTGYVNPHDTRAAVFRPGARGRRHRR